MYAVIRTGGKQYRVEQGERLDVERVGAVDDTVELAPVLVVDGERVVSAGKDLAKVKVKAKVVADAKGPKIVGFTYKNKSNQRKRWGHRQKLSTIEITGITGVPKG
jgi:large subunit ribosomal protein L21